MYRIIVIINNVFTYVPILFFMYSQEKYACKKSFTTRPYAKHAELSVTSNERTYLTRYMQKERRFN